jgi:hypothetical protein
MSAGQYKKKLVLLPLDILNEIEEQALREDRSVSGQLVHLLRKALAQTADPAVYHRQPATAIAE